MKKILCMILILVLLIGTLPVAEAAVHYSAWFKSGYLELNKLGLIPSYFQALDLSEDITRYEMCQLAVPALEKITGDVIPPEKDDYFSDATAADVLKAHERGIVGGYEDGTFRPYNGLTRQEFFVVLVNFCKASSLQPDGSGASLTQFADGTQVKPWAEEAAKICVKYGFVAGKESGGKLYLNPAATLSREEAMTMFLRCYKVLNEYYYYVKTAPAVQPLDGMVSVTTSTLYVREQPSTDGRKLGSLIYGSQAKATAVMIPQGGDPWYQIQYNGKTAYISAAYAKEVTALGELSGAVLDSAVKIVNQAMSYVGYRYVYGGKSPSTGFDCSGLVYYVFNNNGYKMNRVANDQMRQGIAVSKDQLITGDLVFFGYGSYANHVGIYIGNGNFVHASNPSSGVRVSALSETYYAKRYIGARRLIAE